MTTPHDDLHILLKGLRLPSFALQFEEVSMIAEREGWSFGRFLYELTEREHTDRERRRIERFLRQSNIPKEKTLASFDLERIPKKVKRQIPALCEGLFVNKAENILTFGLPGRGKTHLVCAIAHELIQKGYRILFTPSYHLVQRLLIAKKELRLEKELRKLDSFEVVILDDIGYIQQDRDEMEVLFTFLSERYERKSVMITSNLVFSQWDKIFKDPMTTACAIDRLVHHATIIELTGKSYRTEAAESRNQSKIQSN